MSQDEIVVPKGWESKKLSEICTKITDGAHKSPQNSSKGDFYYITAKNIRPWKINLSNATFVSKKDHDEIFSRCNPEYGDVLLTKDGSFGYATVNDFDFPFSMLSSVALLKPDSNKINSYYLAYFLNSPELFKQICGEISGSAIKRIVLRDIKNLTILYPIDLKIQKKIVQKLDDLLEKFQKKKEEILKFKQFTAHDFKRTFYGSVLNEAFSGNLTKNWRKNNSTYDNPLEILKKIKSKHDVKKFEKSSFDDLLDTPNTWIWTQLGHLADLFSGRGFQENEYSSVGIKLLQIANVSFGKIIWNSEKFLPMSYQKSHSDFTLSENDVLLALNRPILKNKLKIGIIKKTDLPSILYQRVGKLNFYDDDLRKYVFYYMQSQFFIKNMKKTFRGSDQPFINKGNLLSLPVPLTTYLEQKEIVSLIEEKLSNFEIYSDKIKQIELTKNHILQYLDILPSSILSKAFSGKLVQ